MKVVFARMYDSLFNKLTAVVSQRLIHRLSIWAAACEAEDIATVESRISEFEKCGQQQAAKHLSRELERSRRESLLAQISPGVMRELFGTDDTSEDKDAKWWSDFRRKRSSGKRRF